MLWVKLSPSMLRHVFCLILQCSEMTSQKIIHFLHSVIVNIAYFDGKLSAEQSAESAQSFDQVEKIKLAGPISVILCHFFLFDEDILPS